MKAVVFAYHNIGCEGIEALLKNGYTIEAIFTHTDNPNQTIWFKSVAELAASKGIPVFAPENVNHPIWVQRIKDIAPDIIFSFYYRNLLKNDLLEIPAKGCYNLHASLLPLYRGRLPINWAIANGEKETGVTLHHMIAAPDSGDIVGQKRVRITDEDTAQTLHVKVARAAGRLLDLLLPQIEEGTSPREPQDHKKSTYFFKRKPADAEIDWRKTAVEVRNLIRAETKPFSGAFSFMNSKKCFFWKASIVQFSGKQFAPGTIISAKPLIIACGKNAIQIESGQIEGNIFMNGPQLSEELSLLEKMRFTHNPERRLNKLKKQKVLILGINGFIGNSLGERLLEEDCYDVYGIDLKSDNINHLIGEHGFTFHEGDITIHTEWLEYHIKKCDIIIPLISFSASTDYVNNPLRVFELEFEENLRIIRYCVKYNKRLIFPSSPEVYGICEDSAFDENSSNLVLGPINKPNWIYSSSKQLLDRVICAYGHQNDLKFTLFRPFNWIGPKLANINSSHNAPSHALTHFIHNLIQGHPLQLVDGGEQKRCFSDITEGIECLYRIIDNRYGNCNSKIINIGNPTNEISIKELAELVVSKFEEHPLRAEFPAFAGYQVIESSTFYGKGYQDSPHRCPSIKNAQRYINWNPRIPLEQSIEETLDYYLQQAAPSDKY